MPEITLVRNKLLLLSLVKDLVFENTLTIPITDAFVRTHCSRKLNFKAFCSDRMQVFAFQQQQQQKMDERYFSNFYLHYGATPLCRHTDVMLQDNQNKHPCPPESCSDLAMNLTLLLFLEHL